MATLTFTHLETHPDGTIGVAGIVNGNWERLELIFDPSLSAADASYNAFTKALTRATTLPSTNGAALQWEQSPGRPLFRPGVLAATTAAPAIDMKGPLMNDFTLSADATFTTSNRAAGWKAESLVRAGASLRNLTFPAWVWIGAAAPASIASGKVGLLELRAFGAADTDIVARWTVQP